MFQLIDPNGAVAFDSPEALDKIRTDGFLRVFQLDSNLALDLSRAGTGSGNIQANPSIELLALAATTDTTIDFDLAINELALGALRSSGDKTRAATLARDIAAGVRVIEAHLGLQMGSIIISHLGPKEVATYRRVHMSFYTHLLRIEQIARLKPTKAAAISNIREYIKWANDDIKMFAAHPFQLALDVFGGAERAVKLLGIGSSKPQENRAWNAAWDLIHAYSMHIETTRVIGKKMKRVILATRDQALAYVAHRCVVAAFVRDGPVGDFTIAGYKIDQPFLLDHTAELKSLMNKAFEVQRVRIHEGGTCTPREMTRFRDSLETQLGLRPAPNAS